MTVTAPEPPERAEGRWRKEHVERVEGVGIVFVEGKGPGERVIAVVRSELIRTSVVLYV